MNKRVTPFLNFFREQKFREKAENLIKSDKIEGITLILGKKQIISSLGNEKTHYPDCWITTVKKEMLTSHSYINLKFEHGCHRRREVEAHIRKSN